MSFKNDHESEERRVAESDLMEKEKWACITEANHKIVNLDRKSMGATGKVTVVLVTEVEPSYPLAISFAAAWSRRRPGLANRKTYLGNKVLLSSAVNQGEVGQRFLEAAGAEAENVTMVGNPFGKAVPAELAYSLEELEEDIKDDPAALAIFETELFVLTGEFDKAFEQRTDDHVRTLGIFADQHAVSVLAVVNMGAAGRDIAVVRRTVAAFERSAAAVFLVSGRTVPHAYQMVATKNLFPHRAPSRDFKCEQVETASGDPAIVVVWDAEPSGAMPDDVLSGPNKPAAAAKQQEAGEMLRTALATGPKLQSLLVQMAADRRISFGVLERAKKDVGAQSQKAGAVWEWYLPDPPVAE